MIHAEDYACRCGCGRNNINPLVMEATGRLAQVIERYFRIPLVKINILSGCRCREHNAAVGGQPQSYHLLGMAEDINFQDRDTEEILSCKEIAYLIQYHTNFLRLTAFGGIGLMEKSLHLDIRPLTGARTWVKKKDGGYVYGVDFKEYIST